jgi:hypothetical protein
MDQRDVAERRRIVEGISNGVAKTGGSGMAAN